MLNLPHLARRAACAWRISKKGVVLAPALVALVVPLGLGAGPAAGSAPPAAIVASIVCGFGHVPSVAGDMVAVSAGDANCAPQAKATTTTWKVPPPPKGCPYHLRSYLEGGSIGDKSSKSAILITHKRRARYHGNYVDVKVKPRSHKVLCRIDYRENNDADITVNPGNIAEPFTGFSLPNPKVVSIEVFFSYDKKYSNDTPHRYFMVWARDKR
jgi:hypothetical protein